MRGAWMLVRMEPRPGEKRENWLLIKEHDTDEEDDAEGLVTKHMTGLATGRDMKGIAAGPQRKPPRAPSARRQKPQSVRRSGRFNWPSCKRL